MPLKIQIFNKMMREQKMLAQHIIEMQGSIFCELRHIVTRRCKQEIRGLDARDMDF